MKSQDLLALSLLTAGETMHSFSSFLPSHFTIKNWVLCAENQADLDQNIANLRSGYRPSVMVGGLMGLFVSIIAKSPLPLAVSLATSGVMIKFYEQALPPELQIQNPLDIFALPPAANNTVIPAEAGIQGAGASSLPAGIGL